MAFYCCVCYNGFNKHNELSQKGDFVVVFKGISKEFSLSNEQQYETLGRFWDEMAMLYGLENLQGLGYSWKDNKIHYAIGLKMNV